MIRDLRRLFTLIVQRKWYYALGAVALVFADAAQVLVAHTIGRAVDAIGDGSVDAAGIGRYAAVLVGLGLIIAVSRYVWRRAIMGSSRWIERRLRQQLYDHLQSLSARFYVANKTGELMAYATNDVPAVQLAAAFGVLAALDAVIQITFAAFMMVSTVDWRLGIVSLAPLIALTPVTYLIGRRLHVAYGGVQEAFATLSDRVQESVSGIRVVKGYAREEETQARFDEANLSHRDHYMGMLKYDVAFDPLITLLAGLAFTIGLAYGGYLVVTGVITLGSYVAFNTYLGMLVWPMLALGWLTNILQRSAASMARLETLFDVEPEVIDHSNAVALASPSGEIELRGLTFSYGPDLPTVLDGVDLSVPAGATVGILGRTGSGKSTLAQLLVRMYDPPPGTVFVDGIDVTELQLADLRRTVAFVPQEGFLFSRTIEENIGFAPERQTSEQVRSAAEIADVASDIDAFEDGFDTTVGERGITLSGGQRQRVALARAIVRDAPVLVLDDCLSAVDTATEARILSRLRSFTVDRTTVIVSHRVSAVSHADEILVLSDGQVAERGTHDELVALNREYARLHRRQQLEAAVEGGGNAAATETDEIASSRDEPTNGGGDEAGAGDAASAANEATDGGER